MEWSHHESERRGLEFVTRKITNGIAKIHLGLADHISLGNLEAKRDWGYAPDYVEAMWRILQQEHPEDYVIAMGETTYVRDFVRMAFAEVGIMIEFKGEGVNEKGLIHSVDAALFESATGKSWDPNGKCAIGNCVVQIDPRYFRPTEVELLIGDPTKSKEKLGWTPKYDLPALVKEMMQSDLKIFQK
jgi:GDPmannose 4,6-dehydratase